MISDKFKELKPSETLAINAKAIELKSNGVDVLNFSAGQPDFNAPEKVKQAGIKAIKEAGFLLTRIIDSHGKEITQADINDIGATVKVLNQVPEASLIHKIGGPITLLVSAKAAIEQRVKVPDLEGLRLNEARLALEEAGLVLGETNTISSK